LSGKQQLIAEGAFDDVSMAIMIHAMAENPSPKLQLLCGSLGFVSKEITFYDREAYGSEPHKGVNALNAAMLALMGIHEIALRALLHAAAPARKLNVTGPEILSVKKTAHRLGEILGKEPVFEGQEGADAYLNDASQAMQLFGYPSVSADTLIEWKGQWLLDGGRGLGKHTCFEKRDGSY